MLHDEKEPSAWKRLHVGAERGVNCEHMMQALVTNTFQRHWEWQEDRRVDLQPGLFRYITAFIASLDVMTAFDVASLALVSKILTLTGVPGHLTAALLAEMQDVRGSASFENCETEFRYSRCIRQGGVEAPVLWGCIANYVFWKAEEKWRAKGRGLSFGGQHDNEFSLRVMMWTDNYWLFSDSRERLVCKVNDIIEELLDLDMERKPESLWRTSTYKHEDKRTLRVGGRDKDWDLTFGEVFDLPGYRFHRDGKGFQGAERSMCKVLRSWWRDTYIYRSKTVPMTTKCKRVHSHVCSTVLNGSINWPYI